jgi:hypothetical protein
LINGTILVLVSSRYLWKECPVNQSLETKDAVPHSHTQVGVPA